MTTTVTLTFNADVAGFDIDGRQFYGPHGEIAKIQNEDFKRRDPVAWTIVEEFQQNGTASGTVTVTAA